MTSAAQVMKAINRSVGTRKGSFALLVGIVLFSATSGGGTTLTLHFRVKEENIVSVQFKRIEIEADDHFFVLTLTEGDMALIEHYFALARIHEYTGISIVGIDYGNCTVRLNRECIQQSDPYNYVVELPSSTLKESIDPTLVSRYEKAVLLQVSVYADTKYVRTWVAYLGVDIVSIDITQKYMTVLCSYEELLALHLSGFHTEVVVDLTGTAKSVPHQLGPEYHTYEEVVSELSCIESDHASIAQVFSLGTSYEGRDIPGIKISDNVSTDESEPEAFICALHHAREAATVEVAMYIIDYLTDHYAEPGYEYVTYLVDNREIYIIPIVNPDGKVYDDSGGSSGHGLYWRKNRQPCTGGIGTDLNRNYSYHWGGTGSSGMCTSQTFRGYAPFDAPESAAVRDFIQLHSDITVLLSYHSYGSLVLWPWGYTYDPIADYRDRTVHQIIGRRYANYTNYVAQQGSDLYLCSGTTDDWSYGTTQNNNIPIFSWTVELEGGSFYPSPSLLPVICENNCTGALYVIECADNPYKVLPPSFGEIPQLFDTNSFFVAGNTAYCTDVLGTGKIAFGLAQGGITENPEGRTDAILTVTEHDTGNLIIVGGPGINPLAQEFDLKFAIIYTYNPGVAFQIACETKYIYLDLTHYPNEDVCIVYLGEDSSRNVMLVWGYGWRGTYAGSVLMGDPTIWQTYQNAHMLMVRWTDSNADGLVQMGEIAVESYV